MLKLLEYDEAAGTESSISSNRCGRFSRAPSSAYKAAISAAVFSFILNSLGAGKMLGWNSEGAGTKSDNFDWDGAGTLSQIFCKELIKSQKFGRFLKGVSGTYHYLTKASKS